MSQWLTMYNRNNTTQDNTKDLYIDVDYWWSPRIRSKKRRRAEKPDPRHREGPAIKGANGGTKSSLGCCAQRALSKVSKR